MAIDTSSLSELITSFRALQAKDSITPETVGYLLQRITDLLATAGTSDTITKIQELLNSFEIAGQALCTFEQGDADRNNILINSSEVDLTDGSLTTRTNNVFIKQATTERAGAMRAQQVTDLNSARTNVAALQKQTAAIEEDIATIQEALGIDDGSSITNVINTAQISCQVVDGNLKILGSQKLVAAGYVPYLFRLTRKRNRYHHGTKYRKTGDENKKYCPETKGWHLYGSCHAVKMNGTILAFSTNDHYDLHKEAESYSHKVTTLVPVHTDNNGYKCIGWGRSKIILNDLQASGETKMRMIRLRFAVGFAKKILPGSFQITPANLVSSMAEFSVIFDPISKNWHFGK